MDNSSLNSINALLSRKYYTTKELAELFNVTPLTIRHWIKDGKLRAFKMGSRYRVSTPSLVVFLKKSEK